MSCKPGFVRNLVSKMEGFNIRFTTNNDDDDDDEEYISELINHSVLVYWVQRKSKDRNSVKLAKRLAGGKDNHVG
ncbi:unnamed protein product [Dovyalis caffra]|uniref:Uncharacterized protein n=1 Tax=Dovyalis caffra TaxID=77055 RepID=A0AAV1S6Y2_9ROSI|nr:unnamed protein product [Dovyalis caffra]